jgi:hypothetical protein
MKRSIDKAVGAILMPYYRIGGRRALQPLVLTRVQTDGSFGRPSGARVAAIVTPPSGSTASQMVRVPDATSSTEAEWASVAFGLRLALENDHETVGLENDCLGVVSALMYPANPLRHAYARYYRGLIYSLTAQTMWTGVRWIPRQANRADDLF